MAEPQPFTFRCPTPDCNRTYRARPEFFGKLMVCQGCQKKIRIPSSAGSPRPPKAQRASDATRPTLTRSVSEGTRPRQQKSPPPRRPAETPRQPVPEFIPDDAHTFYDTDAGYEIVGDYDPLPSASPPPAAWTAPEATSTLEPPVKRKKKKKKNNLQFLEDIVDSPKLLFLFGGAVALFLIVFGIMFAPLALGMRLIGSLFTGAGFIYALRMAFDESPSCGVLYLLDCTSVYRIYYTVTRWPDMKHAFFAEMFGLLLFVPWVVLTTEDFVNKVPVNLKDFKGIDVDEPDDLGPPPGQFQMPFDDAGCRAPFHGNSGSPRPAYASARWVIRVLLELASTPTSSAVPNPPRVAVRDSFQSQLRPGLPISRFVPYSCNVVCERSDRESKGANHSWPLC